MTRLAKASSILLALASQSLFVSGRNVPTAFIASTRGNSFHTSSSLQAEKLPIMCEEEVMSQKEHGTSSKAVMKDLKWGCDYETADRICNFNRHYAEHAGYWCETNYLTEIDRVNQTKYFDSVTGNHLFTAPVGRSFDDYLVESGGHGEFEFGFLNSCIRYFQSVS